MARTSLISSYVRKPSVDGSTEEVQNSLENTFRSIQSCPLLDGHLLPNIALVAGDNLIPHKLGRRLLGWFVVRQQEVHDVYPEVIRGSIQTTAIENLHVTGVGTEFLAELVVGDQILVSGSTRTVATIINALELTVTIAFGSLPNDTAPKKLVSFRTLDLFDKQGTNTNENVVLTLNASAAGTVSLWVF